MKKIIFLILCACAILTSAHAQNGNHQPYTNYWFPSTILNWSAATDTSAPFNRGRVPLASRFIDTNSSPCPSSKNPTLKLACLTIGNASTSANPSQGYDHAGEYAFGFWQYIDRFVMWGGSAGEGLILAPNPTWIDAGHRNGVKVMGNIYLPPTAFGGQLQWVNDMVDTDANGHYIVADKLIEVANYYGFDGWFLNQEKDGASAATGIAFEKFMAYFQAHKTPNMEIMWYDAMLPTGGTVGWQGELNSSNAAMFQNGPTLESNTMFIDFRWKFNGNSLTDSKAEALTLGRDPFDLYAGIDVQQDGYNTVVNWSQLFPTVTTPNVSVGLYIPSWTFHSSPDKNNIPLFYQREEKFWNGGFNSPCIAPTSGWLGFAQFYIEKSVINSWPFITRFNTGQGTNGFWVDGIQLSTKQWHNQSDQELLPTWRWVSETSGTGAALGVDWDFTDAFNGGNSLKVSGPVLNGNNPTDLRLYNTKLLVSNSSNLAITYKMSAPAATNMKVALAFTDTPTNFVYLDCGSTSTNGWETKSIDISQYHGKTLCVVGLHFERATAVNNYAINIGGLAFTDGSVSNPEPPTNLHLTTYKDCENAELQVLFDTSASANTWYYDIYRIKPDNTLQWLGRSPNNAYYVKNIKRIDYETSTNIAVVAVNTSGLTSPQVIQSFTWPANTTNEAVHFDGISKQMKAGIVSLNGNYVTLEAWVNANSFSAKAPIIGIDDTNSNAAYLHLVNNNVVFGLNVGGSIQTLTSATALNTNAWHHIAGTYDGANMKLYIDGVQDATQPAGGTVKATGTFFIGSNVTPPDTSYYDGLIDEARAWTVARTVNEIAGNECTVSTLSSGLEGYWPFNDCTELVAYDHSENTHDGIPANMTAADWVTTTPCPNLAVANINSNLQSIRLYPNPVLKGFNLILELQYEAKADYYIYNTSGSLLTKGSTAQKQTPISVDNLSPGVYLFRVVSDDQTYTGKFTVL